MRIERIEASWFRGAAEKAVLATSSKSVVIYGPNGSGKSTFPDAIEYVHEAGKIAHLAHEYSGYRLERGIRNTRTPEGTPSTLRICLDGGRRIEAQIDKDGRFSITDTPQGCLAELRSGDLRRLILRQDEVAHFIHCPKGEKYSVLLPLLGLSQLEQAAENLRGLQQSVRQQGALPAKEQHLQDLVAVVGSHFPDRAPDKVLGRLEEVARRYIGDEVPDQVGDLLAAMAPAIESRVQAAEPDQQRHVALNQILQEPIIDRFSAMTAARQKAKGQLDRAVDHRIVVLERALEFAEAMPDDTKEINCPACGRPINVAEFTAHVNNELHILRDARSARDEANEAETAFLTSYARLRDRVEDEHLLEWLKAPPQTKCASHLTALEPFNLAARGVERRPDEDQAIMNHLGAVMVHLRAAADKAPPTTMQLIADKAIVEAAGKLAEINKLERDIAGIRSLIEALAAGENAVRTAIRSRTSQILQTISEEIRRLWAKLHPAEPIEDVKLYLPEDADKAIDIGLRFFGTDQPSPRLTLSEGHRNSLGLCIFLALVKMDATADRPIVLDDVVSSLDREHRGFLADVIKEDFAGHQILLFTHDREWFAELRARLPSANWNFMSLLPWRSPEVGLQWSASVFTFDEARALIATNPEAAGNRIRANMDGNLAVVAEKLRLPMPFARGDRNDHRTAADFLPRIIAEAGDKLRKRDGISWTRYSEPLEDWREAHSLLVAWGNPASHSGSLTSAEAERLLAACEQALQRFYCESCKDPIWISDQASRQRLQCGCGELQWRYG